MSDESKFNEQRERRHTVWDESKGKWVLADIRNGDGVDATPPRTWRDFTFDPGMVSGEDLFNQEYLNEPNEEFVNREKIEDEICRTMDEGEFLDQVNHIFPNLLRLPFNVMFADVVNRGAKLLDEKRPTWFKEINLHKLDLMIGGHCILGQLYGGTSKGMSRLGLFTQVDLFVHGFSLFSYGRLDYNWGTLTEAWKRDILSSRSGVQMDRELKGNNSKSSFDLIPVVRGDYLKWKP